MKNDNKGWLFWFAILMIAFNVILLAYIVVGMNKADIRLSSTSCVGGSWDDTNKICKYGDSSSNTIISLKGSKIRDSDMLGGVQNTFDDNRLTLVAGAGKKGIKMTGVSADGSKEDVTNVWINGNLNFSGLRNGINVNHLESDSKRSASLAPLYGLKVLYENFVAGDTNFDVTYYNAGGIDLISSKQNPEYSPTIQNGGTNKLKNTAHIGVDGLFFEKYNTNGLMVSKSILTAEYIILKNWKCSPKSETDPTWECKK